jgi:uncharacterized protein (UPF0333 family)
MSLRRPSLALVLGVLALLIAAVAVAFVATGTSVAGSKVSATTKPKPRKVLRLDAKKRFPAAAIPTVDRAKIALRIGRLRAQNAVLGCPSGAVDLGTWCMDRGVRGVASYGLASRLCVREGGRLPTAGQLVGAAAKLRLSSRADDRPWKALVDPSGRHLRELSSTVVTTTTGSAAAGSFKNAAPTTLQYVTVFDNGDAGGFAGGVAVGTPERFRCAYRKRQPGAR